MFDSNQSATAKNNEIFDVEFWENVTLLGIEALMTLFILGVIGLMIRNWIESKNKKREDEEVQKRINADFKRDIIDEYIKIFSQFYSVRKVYHSCLLASNQVFEEEDRKQIKIESLKTAANLEGKYGSLKVRIINHYDLPKDNWDISELAEIESQLEEVKNLQLQFRLKLDLLARYYDKWRNSIIAGTRIDAESNPKFYKLYNDILAKLESRKVEKNKVV